MIEDYLRMIAEIVPRGIDAFILKHGRSYRVVSKTYRGRRSTPKECYKNAGEMAIFNRTLTYVEGYVVRAALGIPIMHAWLVDSEGNVIDPTLKRMDGDENNEYFGVPFTRDYLLEVAFRSGTWGVIEYNDKLLSGEEDFGIA